MYNIITDYSLILFINNNIFVWYHRFNKNKRLRKQMQHEFI